MKEAPVQQGDTPALFEDFLEEVQALDDFREQYRQRYQFEGLGRQDQDVQRLMEAMAFYSARTRKSAERSLDEYKRRALERLFPHLLTPMPELAILHPVLGTNVQDTQALPAAVVVTAHPPPDAPGAPAKVFRTRAASNIYPLHVVERSVRLRRRPRKEPAQAVAGAPKEKERWQLELAIGASKKRAGKKRFYEDVNRPLDGLKFQINPSGDLLLALRTFDALRQAFRKVTCRFYSGEQELQKMVRRNIVFGNPRDGSEGSFDNPLEGIRRLIHFPAGELCFTLDLDGGPAEWDLLTLNFDLNETWPQSLGMGDSSFILNAIVVENLERRSAEVIEVNGRRSLLPIVHPEPEKGMAVREIMGVYLGDPQVPGARSTVFPNLLLESGYSVSISGAPPQAWLEVEANPRLLTEPRRLYVDVEWYQPALPVPPSRITAESHDVGDVRWAFAQPLRGSKLSAVGQDVEGLEQLLDLQGVKSMDAADLCHLLKVLGVKTSDLFARVPGYINSVSVEVVPDLESPLGGVKCYDIGLRKVPPVLIPTIRLLMAALPEVLGAWTGEREVKVSLFWEDQPELDGMLYTWRVADD